MKTLNKYFELQERIFKYFGYVEDWTIIPLQDLTNAFWYFDGQTLAFSYVPMTETIAEEGKEMYTYSLYTQRFLPKWVYEKKRYTMIVSNTECDGNKVLSVLDNKKKIKDENVIRTLKENWM